jgi:hypothetical protein
MQPLAFTAVVLVLVGAAIWIWGSLWFLVAAFSQSVLWGLGSLLLPFPVGFIFLIVHWPKAKKPFGVNMLGLVMLVLGFAAVLVAHPEGFAEPTNPGNLPNPAGQQVEPQESDGVAPSAIVTPLLRLPWFRQDQSNEPHASAPQAMMDRPAPEKLSPIRPSTVIAAH